MKNGITNREIPSVDAHSVRSPGHIPMFIVIAVTLLAATALGISVFFFGSGWPEARYTVLLLASSALLVGTLATQQKDNLPANWATKTCHDDDIAPQISWAPLRSYARGESRNCKINPDANAQRLLFLPILSFQYTLLILAASVLFCLIATSLTASLPHILQRSVAATPDPVFTTFICLFSCAVMCCVAWLLRKPVRSLEFNKDKGVFWIEKYRVFGWKVGESAQMPISQIHALQVISYTKPDAQQIDAEIALNCQHQERNRHVLRNHEVNVVFRNTERVNIICHRNCNAIKQDTDVLASFLDVPIWTKPPSSDLN